MSEEVIQAEYRCRRVKRLKKCIILMLIISIAFPIVLSLVLLVRVHGLESRLEAVTQLVEELAGTVESQREQTEFLRLELEKNRQDEQGNRTEDGHTEADAREPGEENGQPGQELRETAGAAASHKVYLTFDDGPSIYTQDILDILERYNVKATFFVIGKESESAQKSLQRIVEDGHTLGMHSYSHVYSQVYASVEDFSKDFTKLREYLYEVTGVQSSLYRFPGGSSNTVSKIPMEKFADYLYSQDVVFYDWNISSGDASSEKLSAEEIVQNCTANITKYGTSVILLHDTAEKKSTVEALPEIIEEILAMEDTVLLPITEDTQTVQHIRYTPGTETEQQTKEQMEE